eukprot:1157712-Pelagomonas_calceolata.AAC.5
MSSIVGKNQDQELVKIHRHSGIGRANSAAGAVKRQSGSYCPKKDGLSPRATCQAGSLQCLHFWS